MAHGMRQPLNTTWTRCRRCLEFIMGAGLPLHGGAAQCRDISLGYTNGIGRHNDFHSSFVPKSKLRTAFHE